MEASAILNFVNTVCATVAGAYLGYRFGLRQQEASMKISQQIDLVKRILELKRMYETTHRQKPKAADAMAVLFEVDIMSRLWFRQLKRGRQKPLADQLKTLLSEVNAFHVPVLYETVPQQEAAARKFAGLLRDYAEAVAGE